MNYNPRKDLTMLSRINFMVISPEQKRRNNSIRICTLRILQLCGWAHYNKIWNKPKYWEWT